jgi:lysylphosphatidylglycerol synthetase-like protein (DUF2156 family)
MGASLILALAAQEPLRSRIHAATIAVAVARAATVVFAFARAATVAVAFKEAFEVVFESAFEVDPR